MDFLEMARKRFSVRRFDTTRKVEEATVKKIMEAAEAAPTGHNNQSQRILILENEEALKKLKGCTPCHYNAPLAFVISYDRTACWVREADGAPSGPVDASVVVTHMMFEAFEQGVGSCLVMGFDAAALRREFHIPLVYEPVVILVCGYPSSDCRPSSRHANRKPMETFAIYNDYEIGEETDL